MLKVQNWSSYQSYKDRKPPWIRLHKSMLDNYEYHSMGADARALLPMLWLLASEDEDPVSGLIRDSYEKIAFRLRLPVKTVTNAVKECIRAGFIADLSPGYNFVSNTLRGHHESVTPETEAEADGERKRSRVTLEQLSVDHIAEWLAKKRSEGRYLKHDEHFILEYFRNYCQSKGKHYDNYVAGYRNAFEWDRCQPKAIDSKLTKDERARAAVLEAAIEGGFAPG